MSRPPSQSTRSIASRHAAIGAGLFASLLLGACASSPKPQGQSREIQASYDVRTLKAHLDSAISVLAVQAAAERALRSRGYTITSSSATGDHARITGRAAGSSSGILGGIGAEQVVVESSAGNDSTDLHVRCEPWGDERASRAVMDAVLNRLGR